MNDIVARLEHLLSVVSEFASSSSEVALLKKPSPEKWSKKELIGHLIDSGINNLQRFTEIQFSTQPFKIRRYNQDELVRVNDYQNADISEIVTFLLAINRRIINVVMRQTDRSLTRRIAIDTDHHSDLRFLIQDYVDHFQHHVNQIIDPTR